MTSRAWGPFTVGLGVMLLAALTAAAPQGKRPERGARIAVVALHDSGLLTLCPVIGKDVLATDFWTSSMSAKATVSIPPVTSEVQSVGVFLDRQRPFKVTLPLPAARSSSGAVPQRTPQPPLERLAHDAEVQARLEEQFRARGTFTLVSSPNEADFVFLAESTYVPRTFAVTERLSGKVAPPVDSVRDRAARIFSQSEDEWNQRSLGSWFVLPKPAPNAPPEEGPGYSGSAGGDGFRNWRDAILALVVPREGYARHAGDGAALASASVWQGIGAWSSNRSGRGDLVTRAASPEALIDAFHGRTPQVATDRAMALPDYLPVCAASPGTIRSIDEPPEEGLPEAAREADSTAKSRRPRGQARFSTHISLVTVPVSVTDANGQPVVDLVPAAFRIFEDDVEQVVERLDLGTRPVEITALIDTSSSMAEPLDGLRMTADRLVAAVRRADRLQVVSLGDRIRVAQELTANQADLRDALTNLRPGGGTRLYDALALVAVDRLGRDAREAIVLLTDGRDTRSQLTDATGALTALETTNAPVFVIQYQTAQRRDPAAGLSPPPREWVVLPANPGDDPGTVANQDAFLRRLATETGGRMYVAGPGADPSEIVAHIANELSSQHVLGYYSTNPTLDGSYRRIRVTVDGTGYTVRARAGYRAGALLGAR